MAIDNNKDFGQVSARIGPDLKRKLDIKLAEDGISQTEWMRVAIQEYVDGLDQKAARLSFEDREKLTTFTEILQARAEDRIDANWAGFLEAIRGGVFNWLAMWKQAVSTEAKYSKKS